MSDLVQFYNNTVCKTVYDKLPNVFPDFGWKETSKGYIATNADYTKSHYGVRPDRVVCYKPSGLFIFGDSRPPISWVSLVTSTENPKGTEWVNGVKKLCELTSIQFPITEKQIPKKSNLAIFEAFSQITKKLLLNSPDMIAQIKTDFGLTKEQIKKIDIGYFEGKVDWEKAKEYKETGKPVRLEYYRQSQNPVFLELEKKFSEDEIHESCLFYDSRWIGRFVGAWRKQNNEISTFWARAIGECDQATKYLYLKNGQKTSPYLAQNIDFSADILVVEGIKDALSLYVNGFKNVVALGSLDIGPSYEIFFKENGTESITLCFDYDATKDGRFEGQKGTINSIKILSKHQSRLYVIPPESLGSNFEKKDAHEIIQTQGMETFYNFYRNRLPAYEYFLETMEKLINPENLLIEIKSLAKNMNSSGQLNPEQKEFFSNKLALTKETLDIFFAMDEIQKLPISFLKRFDKITQAKKYINPSDMVCYVFEEGLQSLEEKFSIR